VKEENAENSPSISTRLGPFSPAIHALPSARTVCSKRVQAARISFRASGLPRSWVSRSHLRPLKSSRSLANLGSRISGASGGMRAAARMNRPPSVVQLSRRLARRAPSGEVGLMEGCAAEAGKCVSRTARMRRESR